MGHSLISIPFWTDSIGVREVISATRREDFYIRNLADLGQTRLNKSSLYQRDDNGNLVLELENGDFIEFQEDTMTQHGG